MSTFSVVGAVIPVAAAGSLFAGMYVGQQPRLHLGELNSGAWLHAHGMELGVVRGVQSALFGLGGGAGRARCRCRC